MAYDKFEKPFPCLCKAGQLIAQWEEHDTWPSPNRHYTWYFACEKCAAEYEVYGEFKPAIVRVEDAKQHRALTEGYRKACSELEEYAVAHYEKQWVDYISRLPSKKAMHSALGSHMSYSTFLKLAQSRQGVESEARSRFRSDPKRCIDFFGMEDSEVSRLHAQAERLNNAKIEFWRGIEKHGFPLQE
jgi:hypothetical protein